MDYLTLGLSSGLFLSIALNGFVIWKNRKLNLAYLAMKARKDPEIQNDRCVTHIGRD